MSKGGGNIHLYCMIFHSEHSQKSTIVKQLNMGRKHIMKLIFFSNKCWPKLLAPLEYIYEIIHS